MWDTLNKLVRRLTYWQWAKFGMLLVMTIGAVACGIYYRQFYRRATAIRAWNSSSAKIDVDARAGPASIHRIVPPWFSREYLSIPRSVTLPLDAMNREELLKQLPLIPSVVEINLLWRNGMWDPNLPPMNPVLWKRTVDLVSQAQQLRTIQIEGPHMTDEDLFQLAKLPHLSSLLLCATSVNGSGLGVLKDCTELGDLEIWPSPISEEGLIQIATLKQLKTLTVCGTPATSAWLSHLQDHPHLTELSWHGPQIGRTGLEHISRIRLLEVLHLHNTRLTDPNALATLSELRQLRELGLAGCGIQDDHIAQFHSFPRLESLYLNGNVITDSALPELAKMSQLKLIDLSDTRVTEQGLKAFTQALPRIVKKDSPPPISF